MTLTQSPDTRRDAKRRRQGTVTPEVLNRDAHQLLAKCGIERSPSWVKRTVRDYARHVSGNGFPFGAYLLNRVEMNAVQRRVAMNDPELASMLCYADPTGETAVNRVIRGANHVAQ
jgi:hypothetical protein